MSNERNVEALADALCWLACGLSLRELPVVAHGFRVRDAYRQEAARLASRGVLAPSAITDEEGYDIGMTGDFTTNRTQEREAMEARLVRAELERIAKGEP